MNKCHEVGISCIVAAIAKDNYRLADKTLRQWAEDQSIDGIYIQRPSLFATMQHVIPADKDVGGVMIDAEYDPCIPRGVMHLIHAADEDLAGKQAVVIGRSDAIGKPIAQMLLEADCTVTVCHSMTHNLASITKSADILVSAAGHPNLITADMVKPGAIVIDVGLNSAPDPDRPGQTKQVGDVDFALVKEVAGCITPVPGGVAPMGVAMLLKNTLTARQEKDDLIKID